MNHYLRGAAVCAALASLPLMSRAADELLPTGDVGVAGSSPPEWVAWTITHRKSAMTR
jgi:hypothetical protein